MGIFGVIYGGPEVFFSTAHNCRTMPLGYNWTCWSDSHCSSGLFLCLKESTVSRKKIIIIKWTVTGHCTPDFSSSGWNLNTFHYNAVLFFFAPQNAALFSFLIAVQSICLDTDCSDLLTSLLHTHSSVTIMFVAVNILEPSWKSQYLPFTNNLHKIWKINSLFSLQIIWSKMAQKRNNSLMSAIRG